ncbi:hypothetical protein R3P38DRAFT_3132548 [Favolaschia claudopus]|uniref:Uncharacterized protein n=1 Tax=Favolaschia claudopus TaxID=2862362 RepID=A0AAV9Z8B7_9AGAR
MFVPFFSRRAKTIARRAGTAGTSSGGASSGGARGGSSGSSSTGGKTGSTGSSSSGSTGNGAGSSSSGSTGKGSSGSGSTGKGSTGSSGTSGEGSTGSGSTGKGSTGSGTTGKGIPGGFGSSTSGKSTPIALGGTSKSISPYSSGGGRPITIPMGQLFGGRSAGGATRNDIYGSRTFGSGYPGYFSRGVGGRGFPFWFWPVAWGSGAGYGANVAYMHSNEYGDPNNSSRPGGPIAMASFQSNSTGTTFLLVADNDTVMDVMPDVSANCSQWLTPASIDTITSTPFNASRVAPEQVVQYYRASSVALTLDGYNNSAVFAPENSTDDTPLPTGIDDNLLGCLNYTIAQAVPLVDGAMRLPAPEFRAVGFVLLLLFLLP